MAVLFISHSSKDDGVASALVAWLRNNGFTDIFLDHDSLAGGDKWRDELRASAAACRVVLCLVTKQWLQSDECFGEFVAAAYTMGRRIIPVFLKLDEPNLTEAAQRRLAKVRSEDQGITLDPCLTASGGLEVDKNSNVAERLRNGLRAAGALSQVGLDPEVFAVDPKLRPTPFPGLSSFGDADADAALFYGRSREIALVLEELRKMRAEGDLRPFVMLGASGAGKSSLLKAGVIPRLRRERPPGCRCAPSVPAPTRCTVSRARSRLASPISGRSRRAASSATGCCRLGGEPRASAAASSRPTASRRSRRRSKPRGSDYARPPAPPAPPSWSASTRPRRSRAPKARAATRSPTICAQRCRRPRASGWWPARCAPTFSPSCRRIAAFVASKRVRSICGRCRHSASTA